MTVEQWLATPYAMILFAGIILAVTYIAVVERRKTPVGEYECSCHGYLYENNGSGDWLYDVDHRGVK